jgi:uncharacterized protein (DUF1697 family)
MRYVAFLRNVNQGQRGHPTTADIMAGFAAAGCLDATPFQSNGTIVFEADDPAVVADTVFTTVAQRTGLERDVFWISFADVVAVVESHAAAEPRGFEFTLHRGGAIDLGDPEVGRETARNRCEIVDIGTGWALVRNAVAGEGHATPTIERLTGDLATSRGLPTLVRLVNRFA